MIHVYNNMSAHVASIIHDNCFGWLRSRLRELWTTERLNQPTRRCCCCCRRHCCCWRRCCWCCYLRCCCWRCCYCCWCLRCYFCLCCCCSRRCFWVCFVSSVRFGCSRSEQLVACVPRIALISRSIKVVFEIRRISYIRVNRCEQQQLEIMQCK